MSLILYAHPFSSYCQKVLIALYESATPFELRMLSHDNPTAGAEFAISGRFAACRSCAMASTTR